MRCFIYNGTGYQNLTCSCTTPEDFDGEFASKHPDKDCEGIYGEQGDLFQSPSSNHGFRVRPGTIGKIPLPLTFEPFGQLNRAKLACLPDSSQPSGISHLLGSLSMSSVYCRSMLILSLESFCEFYSSCARTGGVIHGAHS